MIILREALQSQTCRWDELLDACSSDYNSATGDYLKQPFQKTYRVILTDFSGCCLFFVLLLLARTI